MSQSGSGIKWKRAKKAALGFARSECQTSVGSGLLGQAPQEDKALLHSSTKLT